MRTPGGGGRQGNELDVSAYMKGFLRELFETDPCAREFRQRSIMAPNMVKCAQNARPLEAFKFAILGTVGDSF